MASIALARAQKGAGRVGREMSTAAVIVFMALVLFVATGVQVIPAAVAELFRAGGGSDRVAATALLLNIALLMFAWRRYADVRTQAHMRRLAEERAEILESRDQLTNLLVRRSVGENGDSLIREAGGSGAGMLVLNLDRFKNVNDVYGHIAGDALLRSVADAVLQHTPADGLCARIGADEFCLLLPLGDGGEDRVEELAERLAEHLRKPVPVSSVEIHVKVSIGLARTAADCDKVEALLRRADIAMHAGKKAGGNQIVWFDSSMESVLRARNEIEAGLRRGIPVGEFVPHYQPQVNLATGRLEGFEVLARWNHPEGGTVGPDLFIDVAEETGLIGDLFDSVFFQALSEARDWDPGLAVAVNVSPGQLKDPWLAHRILKVLTEVGFPAERLEVEITESSLFENLALAQTIVASLKNQGVRLALDDFGTGYSSLAHLRALPFDKIKIDRSFVKAMARDSGSLAIVTAIAKIGESLDVSVTAEGVEGSATADRLRSIGCRTGQGWFYGKPADGAATAEMLSAKGLLCAPPIRRPAAELPAPDEQPRRSAA